MSNKYRPSWPWCVARSQPPASLERHRLAWWLLLIAALAALCTAPRPSFAQSLPTAIPVATASNQSVKLMVGEGRVLLFDSPVDSVFVANASIGDVKVIAPDTVYVWGKKSGTTNLIALSAGRKIQATIDFRVAINPEPPNEAQRELQPTSTTRINILGERAVVTGRANGIEGAVTDQNTAEIYSPLGQPPLNDGTLPGSQQVNIRVRFAEVSRNELQQLGFNWRIFGSVGNLSMGRGIMGSGINIDVLVEALQRNGLLNILAEPNLTAVTGESASFLAGGEVPVPIAQPNGTMSIDYKPFGVSLAFTPTIIKTNRIALHVRPEVSALSPTGGVKFNGIDIPSFTVRRADTTVEVASGQTFAIAGMFQRQLSEQLDKFPFLAEVPILGAIFTSRHYRRDETELVILITPYLVKPSKHMVATPLDRPAAPPAPRTKAQSAGLIFK
jgi:pilus assembly protein CpaC